MELYSQILAALEAAVRLSPRGNMPSLTLDQRHRGINTPAVRKLARQFSQKFADLSWNDQARVVQDLLEYGSDRAAHLGVFLLGSSTRNVHFVDAQALDFMVGAFQGWSVTDAFCIEVLQPLFEGFTSEVLSLIAGWAVAESQWKRRASVVVFVRKIGASGKYTQHGLDACERLIADPEDLVRKGVGWALKDLMRGDRNTVLATIGSLRKRGVPSVITLYALRDITGDERRRILAIQR